MTAEIVIMNKSGVAVAADSAVTFTTKRNDGFVISEKVYNSANKLFSLSSQQPVGIMVYGNGSFLGCAWDLIIKLYRNQHLKERSFPSVEEYFHDFISFLSVTHIFNRNDETSFLLSIVEFQIAAIRHEANIKIKSILDESHSVKEDQINTIYNESMESATRKYVDHLANSELQDDFCSEVCDIFETEAANYIKMALPNIVFDKNIEKRFLESCVKLIGIPLHINGCTGIVITGYGENEIFPALSSCTIEGRINNYISTKECNHIKISNECEVEILPYAQINTAKLFINGIDPDTETTFNTMVEHTLNGIPEQIAAKLNVKLLPAQRAILEKEMKEVSRNLKISFNDYTQNTFVSPLCKSVAILPLEEIASMARTLVNLASFKLRVSQKSEIVGGPIDLAVISKGDGFIWINRKHYFNKELNADFYHRRYGVAS